MKTWSTAGVLGVLLASGAARAQEEPPSVPLFAVILGEDATYEKAERQLQAYTRKAPEGVEAGGDFPRVLTSEELPGLPEGRHFAVLGFCESPEEAQAAVRQVKRVAPKARVARTTASAEVSCPGLTVARSRWELEARAWVGKQGKEAKHAWFVYRKRTGPEACPDALPYRLVVREDERVLAQQELGAECEAPEGAAQSASSDWHIELFELDTGMVVWTRQQSHCCGDTTSTHSLYAFGCGKLVKKQLGVDMEHADPGSLTVEQRPAEEGRPAAVLVTRTLGPGDPEPTVEEHTWDSKQCRFVTKRGRALAP